MVLHVPTPPRGRAVSREKAWPCPIDSAAPVPSVVGPIHWVSAAQAIDCDLNLYDKLFTIPDPDAVEEGQDFLSVVNPESLVVIEGAKIEPSVGGDPIGSRYQFERTGYFISEPASTTGRLTFNRTVTLRDSWAKMKEK